MYYDLDVAGPRPMPPVQRDVRHAAIGIARHQLGNQVRVARADSDTDATIEVMEDDTIATGKAMEKIIRVARLQRQLEELAPGTSGRLALLADDHAYGMHHAVTQLRRRLYR